MDKKRIFSIPNMLTFLRFLMLPLIGYFYFTAYDQTPWIVIGLMAGAVVTDLFDGLLARRLGMVTDFGKVFDPAVDKIFLNAILIFYVVKDKNLLVIIILALHVLKEGYLFIAASILYKRKFVLSSKLIGKAASFTLDVGLIAYLFNIFDPAVVTVTNIVLSAGLLLSLSAAVCYTVIVYRQTGGHLPPKLTAENAPANAVPTPGAPDAITPITPGAEETTAPGANAQGE
jgi:cardiolipin synthase